MKSQTMEDIHREQLDRDRLKPAGVGVEMYTAGQRVTYDSGYWTVEGEVTGNVEGWWNVRFDDGSSATVRPSSIRAAIKGDGLRINLNGGTIGERDE